MSFSWESYLLLAHKLSAGQSEAHKRSAVSRAYYAAFGSAKAYLEKDIGGPVENPQDLSSHVLIWSHYKDAPNMRKNQIGVTGNRLKWRRVRADYHQDFEDLDGRVGDLRKEVSASLKMAETILSELSALEGRTFLFDKTADLA